MKLTGLVHHMCTFYMWTTISVLTFDKLSGNAAKGHIVLLS